MMENSGIYNVIWIDDKYEEIDLLGNAEQDNIFITPYKYGKDGISAIQSNLEFWDGVIIDVKCLWASEDEVDRVDNFHKIKEELLILKSKRPIPFFVYSGQPDVLSDESFKVSLNGRRLYKKHLDEEALLHDIKEEANKLPEVQIRHKYLDAIGSLPDNIVIEMTDILSYVEDAVTDKPDVFNKMRAILDWLMVQLNEYGLLAVKHNGANLNACSVYLGKKELSDYVPVHIQRSMHSCVEICNNGSHRIEIFNYVQSGQAPFLIRSTVFELLNLLKWYNLLPRDAQSVAKMKALVATVPPEDVIEGKLEQDEFGNFHCCNCLIYKEKVFELNLKINELIRVTSHTENTKGHPAVIAKYPRFAHKLQRQ